MHVAAQGKEGVKEEARELGTVKSNGTKREGRVETALKSLDREGRKQRGGRWQRTAVATAVEAHEHHFY